MSNHTQPVNFTHYITCAACGKWAVWIIFAGTLLVGKVMADELVAPLAGWHTDLEQATAEARSREHLLVIYFRDPNTGDHLHNLLDIPVRHTTYYATSVASAAQTLPNNTPISRPAGVSPKTLCEEFERETLTDLQVQSHLAKTTCVVLPTTDPLLTTDEFAEMDGRAGLAILSLANACGTYEDSLVSAMPFVGGRAFRPDEMEVLLTLPHGSLTQRTLIYAVKTHQHAPQSANGKFHPVLQRLATDHAIYQSQRHSIGHSNYGKRQAVAKAEVPGVVSTSEICAVNGFNRTVLEAAIALVRQWRGSPPHWSAMRRHHDYYAYDMVTSSRGHWYSVGFFARREKVEQKSEQAKSEVEVK